MKDTVSNLLNYELMADFFRQLGFEYDWSCWGYRGKKNSLCLIYVPNHIEIGLCVGNSETFTPRKVLRFLAGSLYSSTITEDNIEQVKEDIKTIVEEFKKKETPDYVINRFSCLKDFELVVTLTNKDVDLRECLEKVKTLETDKHFIIFDTAIYGGFCGERFLVKYVSNGVVDDEILALSVTEEESFVFSYSKVVGNKTIHGDYNLVKQLNLLLYKLKSNNFFQCDTTNLDDIIPNVNIKDIDFKHPDYSVMRF